MPWAPGKPNGLGEGRCGQRVGSQGWKVRAPGSPPGSEELGWRVTGPGNQSSPGAHGLAGEDELQPFLPWVVQLRLIGLLHPSLGDREPAGSLPTAQVSGNPGPIRVSAESLWLLSSPALLQRAASCPPPPAGFSRLLCQLPGRHASRHSLQIHVHGHVCVSAYMHMYLRM